MTYRMSRPHRVAAPLPGDSLPGDSRPGSSAPLGSGPPAGARELLVISHLPVSDFAALSLDERICLFIEHLAHQFERTELNEQTARLIGDAQLSGIAADSSRHHFTMFELNIRFACQERVGIPMSAAMYRQLVLPLLSIFFMQPASTRILITGLSERASALFHTATAG